MAKKGCGPYNLGAPKSMAKQTSGTNVERGREENLRQPSAEERASLQNRSQLTDKEREVLNQRNLTPDKPTWDLSRKNQGKYFNRLRKEGTTNAESFREELVGQQRMQDSARMVNNRFHDGIRFDSQNKSGNTGKYVSEPYIDMEDGEIKFRPQRNSSPNNKVKSAAYKMKGYGSKSYK